MLARAHARQEPADALPATSHDAGAACNDLPDPTDMSGLPGPDGAPHATPFTASADRFVPFTTTANHTVTHTFTRMP